MLKFKTFIILVIVSLMSMLSSFAYDCTNSSWETFLYAKINNTGMPVANVTVSIVANLTNASQPLNYTTLQVMKRGTSTTYPFYLARGLKTLLTEWNAGRETIYIRVAESWATGEIKEFQLCAANSSVAATVTSVENNHSAFVFYNDFQDYSVGDQLMTCNVFQTHQINTCENGLCLETNTPSSGLNNYCENLTFFTDSRYANELIDTTRPFTYHEITQLPNTFLRMDYMWSLRNATAGSVTGAYPYVAQDITINGVDFEPNAIFVNSNLETWTLVLPNQSALYKRFIPSNDYNFGTQKDISFQNMTITGYRVSSKNEGGGSPPNAYHDEIWLAYSLEKYNIEYNATGNSFGTPLPPSPPSPPPAPVLNYSNETNITSNANISITNAVNATGYEWYVNGSLQQNTSSSSYIFNFTAAGSYGILVIPYNNATYGTASLYVYLLGAPPMLPVNYTPAGTPTLNYPSGNYSTQLNLIISGVVGAAGYVWLENGSIVQNSTLATFTTNFIFNNTYGMQVYGYNGSYIGEYSTIYIYSYYQQAINVTNVTYQDRMQVNTCPNTISGVLNIWLFFFIGLILLIMGLVYNKIMSLLGSVTIIISAFYMSACAPFVALVAGLGGVIAFSYSAIKQD